MTKINLGALQNLQAKSKPPKQPPSNTQLQSSKQKAAEFDARQTQPTNNTTVDEPATVPAESAEAFMAALDKLDTMISADDPIRDATMEIISRVQSSSHLADFMYETPEAFAIAIRALRKLHSNRTEKRADYRKKKQKKVEDVNAFMNDLKGITL